MALEKGPLDGLTENEIVSRYQRWAHKVAYVWGGYDNTEHEDLAQEALIGVWLALQSYEPDKGAMASYLAQGGKTQLHECLRRDKWTGSPSLKGSVRSHPAIPLSDDDPLFDAELKEDFSVLTDLLIDTQSTLHELSPDHRKYVYLRFWLDMAPSDIEQHLDISGRHAWKLIRQQLQELLGD